MTALSIILIRQVILWWNIIACPVCNPLISIFFINTHLDNNLYVLCKSLVPTRLHKYLVHLLYYIKCKHLMYFSNHLFLNQCQNLTTCLFEEIIKLLLFFNCFSIVKHNLLFSDVFSINFIWNIDLELSYPIFNLSQTDK